MLIASWIITGLLALVFLAAGLMKLARSRTALAASGMAWVDDFSDTAVKLIGAAEVIGAVGLVLPPLLGIAPVLGPIAAAALAVLMIGAVATHLRRKEGFLPALVLAVLSVAASVLGFLNLT